MRYIQHKFIDVNENQDIFGYYREFYQSDDLHSDGYVTLFSPGEYGGDEENRSNLSTLINERDDYRWVSNEEYPYLTIDFHTSVIDLLYYTLETHAHKRFMKQWAVYGIEGDGEVLVDKRDDEPLCSISCTEYTMKTFQCQYPGSFHKFKIIATGMDSKDATLLSLSAIQFFGVIFTSPSTCERQVYSLMPVIVILSLFILSL